jgi:hypothetical protein
VGALPLWVPIPSRLSLGIPGLVRLQIRH